MDKVETWLADLATVGIVRIHPSVPHVASRLRSLQPCAAIIDLDAPHLDFLPTVLIQQPGLPILCLDATCGQMLALTAPTCTIRSIDGLLHMVQDHTRANQVQGGDGQPLPAGSSAVDVLEFLNIQTEGER